MSYEISIISLGQKVPCKFSCIGVVELRNEIDHLDIDRFRLTWPFLARTNGIWYSLGINEDGWFNTMSIIDIDFDEVTENIHHPYWIKDIDIQDNIRPIILYSKYKDEFTSILKNIIQESPLNMIMFLCRFQGGDEELVYGVIKSNDFINMLENRKVYSNICYIISG